MSRAEAKAELNQILAAQLHRATPIDFVLPEDDEQAVRDGFDRAMKAPIKKPIGPPLRRDPEREAAQDVRASAFSFWAWTALMWTALWLGIGYLFGRYVS
jgi:hypothetical protein